MEILETFWRPGNQQMIALLLFNALFLHTCFLLMAMLPCHGEYIPMSKDRINMTQTYWNKKQCEMNIITVAL